VSQTCSEPLVWTCKACGHAFKEKEWIEAGRSCPVCENKAGHWKCSLCQGEFVQPSLGNEHPCRKTIFTQKPRIFKPFLRSKYKTLLEGLAGVVLLLSIVSGIQYFNQPKHDPTQEPDPELPQGSDAPDTKIIINWSDLVYLGLETEWEPDGTWFVLWEGVPEPLSISRLLYVGVIDDGETRESLIKRIIKIDPLFRERQNILASWGLIVGHDTSLGNLLDSNASVLALCKGIAQVADQNPATRPKDYDGKEQSFKIGRIKPIVLGVDMKNFPSPPLQQNELYFKLRFE